MAKEKIVIEIAGVKTTMLSGNPKALRRMANSVDLSAKEKMKFVSGRGDIALMLVALEQAESLRRNGELIKMQQERIFELTTKLSAYADKEEDYEIPKFVNDALMEENAKLRRKLKECSDEIDILKFEKSKS